MTDVTSGEVIRRLSALEEAYERRSRDFVSKELYERDLIEIKGDIAEINGSQKWMSRLVIAQFATLIIALLLIALAPGSPLG